MQNTTDPRTGRRHRRSARLAGAGLILALLVLELVVGSPDTIRIVIHSSAALFITALALGAKDGRVQEGYWLLVLAYTGAIIAGTRT